MSNDGGGRSPSQAWQLVFGLGLVLLGGWLLGRSFVLPYFPQLEAFVRLAGRAQWALALIAAGIAAIILAQRPGGHRPAAGSRLYRSREKKLVSGVLGGLSDYLGLDVTVLRLAYVAFALLGWWPAVVLYIAGAIVIPLEPELAPGSGPQAPPPPSPGA